MKKRKKWNNRTGLGITAFLLVISMLYGGLAPAAGYTAEIQTEASDGTALPQYGTPEETAVSAPSSYNTTVNIDPILPGEGMTDVVLKNVLSAGGALADIPVYRLCKGTAEGKHYTLFFAGDGYTLEEQEAFIKDARTDMKAFLECSPMNLFADRFDAYAALVPSENSGSYVPGSCETFFHSTGALSTAQRTSVLQKIRNPLADALGINKDTVTHTYPDNEVYNTILIVNKSIGHGIASTGGRYCYIGKNNARIFLHETGHAANSLTDEYFSSGKVSGGQTKANRIYIADIARDDLSAEELSSLTMYDHDKLDVTKVRWNAYLGFRGIYVDSFDDVSGKPASLTELRPNHKQFLMAGSGSSYCSVCEAEIFMQLNKYFGYPIEVFVPKPEFTYPLTENPSYYCNKPSSQGMVKPDKTYVPSNGAGVPEAEFKEYDSLSVMNPAGENMDCAEAAQHDITFRTVVVPFRKAANLKLKLTVLDRNDQILAVREKDFDVSSYYTSQKYASLAATSLELTLEKNEWADIVGSDNTDFSQYKIVGEVIDNATGQVLSTTNVE